MKRLIFTLVAVAAISANAQDTGWFASVSAGKLATKFHNLPSTYTADDTSSSWAVSGGYLFSRNVGLEVGYRDFGTLSTSSQTSTTTTKGTAWTLGGVAIYPLTDRIDAVARAGAFRWSTEASNSVLNYQSSNSGTKAYFGAGLSYALTQQTSVGVNWTRFKSASAREINSPDVFDVAVQYRF